jgi:hypothetical protein
MNEGRRVLRPSLRRRIPYFVLAVLLFALMVVGLLFSPLLGAIGVLMFGFAVINAVLRLFHPRSYATELDADEFRVFDSMGRLVHRVRWVDVEHLTVFHGNGLRGAGTVLHLAWRCHPRRPGPGRQPWSGGGEEFDGALPDPYTGIEPMLELFKRRADAAKART